MHFDTDGMLGFECRYFYLAFTRQGGWCGYYRNDDDTGIVWYWWPLRVVRAWQPNK